VRGIRFHWESFCKQDVQDERAFRADDSSSVSFTSFGAADRNHIDLLPDETLMKILGHFVSAPHSLSYIELVCKRYAMQSFTSFAKSIIESHSN